MDGLVTESRGVREVLYSYSYQTPPEKVDANLFV
jgi:hypothetical protein